MLARAGDALIAVGAGLIELGLKLGAGGPDPEWEEWEHDMVTFVCPACREWHRQHHEGQIASSTSNEANG